MHGPLAPDEIKRDYFPLRSMSSRLFARIVSDSTIVDMSVISPPRIGKYSATFNLSARWYRYWTDYFILSLTTHVSRVWGCIWWVTSTLLVSWLDPKVQHWMDIALLLFGTCFYEKRPESSCPQNGTQFCQNYCTFNDMQNTFTILRNLGFCSNANVDVNSLFFFFFSP